MTSISLIAKRLSQTTEKMDSFFHSDITWNKTLDIPLFFSPAPVRCYSFWIILLKRKKKKRKPVSKFGRMCVTIYFFSWLPQGNSGWLILLLGRSAFEWNWRNGSPIFRTISEKFNIAIELFTSFIMGLPPIVNWKSLGKYFSFIKAK